MRTKIKENKDILIFSVGCLLTKDIVKEELVKSDEKVFYIAYNTKPECFEVYKYKVSDNNMTIFLYNKVQQSPQITLFFKKESKKKSSIITFLEENCEKFNDE